MVIDNSLPVQERLKSKILISRVFAQGKSKSAAPLRLIHLPIESSDAGSAGMIQIMVSVSKKLFPRAVDRNAIKRQLREAYRTQKHLLAPIEPKLEARVLAIALLFTEKEVVDQRIISDKLSLLLRHLVSEYG